METLVHSPDYRRTLQELYRVLKPGGILINYEYAFNDHIPAPHEKDWRTIFEGSAMYTFEDFRQSKLVGIWESAGFQSISTRNITKNVEPFMKRLYQIAFVPYYSLKLFGKEKKYINTYAGVRSYQLRHEFQYTVVKSFKPKK